MKYKYSSSTKEVARGYDWYESLPDGTHRLVYSSVCRMALWQCYGGPDEKYVKRMK